MFPDDIVYGRRFRRAMRSAKLLRSKKKWWPCSIRLQDRLLRYLLSTGVPVARGEEIVQEVFLALFSTCSAANRAATFAAGCFRWLTIWR